MLPMTGTACATEREADDIGPTWSVALTEVAGTGFAADFSATLCQRGEDFLPDTTQPSVDVVGSFRYPIDQPCP